MNSRREKAKRIVFGASMQARLILAFCLLSVFAAATGAAAYYYMLTNDFRARVWREIEATADIQRIAINEQRERAKLIAANLAGDTVLRQAAADADEKKLDDMLMLRLRDVAADYISVTDENGVAISIAGPADENGARRISHGVPVFLDPLFKRAVADGNPSGLELCGSGGVCMNAYAKMSGLGRLSGYVRVGYAIDDRFANRLKKLTGVDFILIREGRSVATSMSGPKLKSREINSLLDAHRKAAKSSPAPERGTAAEQAKRARAASGEVFQDIGDTGRPVTVQMQFRNKPHFFQGFVLRNEYGEELGKLFIGRDTVELARAWKVTLRAIAAIALFSLVLSVALGYTLSVIQAKPINMLMKRVREITAGDLQGSMPVHGSDEIGRLTAAFNEMSGTLAERDRRLRESAEELVRNQEQIIQSGKLAAIGELAAGVAHEIGNPLSAISGYAQMLSKGTQPPDIVKEYSREIEKEAGFIERIIEDLLDFARPSAEGPGVLDMNEIAESALKTASAHKAFSKVEVKWSLSEDAPRVFANRKEMLQVCINLFMNAAQSMTDGGEMAIMTSVENGNVSLQVSDRGMGVDEKISGKIFDPFFTTKPPGVGTGLGLSICYRIVEKYKGRLTFHSRRNGGTKFIVSLPEAAERAEKDG